MRLEDWVTLSVIWWSGGLRRAIADWLSENTHRRICVTSAMTLQGLLADIDRAQAVTMGVSAARARAAVALRAAGARGISAVSWAAEDYRTCLSMITDPPPVLWGRGNLAALTGPMVALAGAGAASAHAREVAGELASGLAGGGLSW